MKNISGAWFWKLSPWDFAFTPLAPILSRLPAAAFRPSCWFPPPRPTLHLSGSGTSYSSPTLCCKKGLCCYPSQSFHKTLCTPVPFALAMTQQHPRPPLPSTSTLFWPPYRPERLLGHRTLGSVVPYYGSPLILHSVCWWVASACCSACTDRCCSALQQMSRPLHFCPCCFVNQDARKAVCFLVLSFFCLIWQPVCSWYSLVVPHRRWRTRKIF